jgi:hypothetical protein
MGRALCSTFAGARFFVNLFNVNLPPSTFNRQLSTVNRRAGCSAAGGIWMSGMEGRSVRRTQARGHASWFFWLTALTALTAAGGLGCDADFVQTGPVEQCVEVAVQCQLAKGPLGVCERTPCEGDRQEPCFVCAPQH